MLKLQGYIAVPPHTATAFDHGDVYLASGQVFVAHTGADTVEVLDGLHGTHCRTIPGCPEGSGVLCAQADGLVFAAARGAGQVLVIAAGTGQVQRVIPVGPRPNGLAWDPGHRHLLVADVQENRALLIDPLADPAGAVLASVALPGRPRWCVFDPRQQRFLVNIRDPAAVVVVAAATAHLEAQWPVSVAGPHGLDLDAAGGRAFVAGDGGRVVALDLAGGHELGGAPLAGVPDATWYNAPRARLYVTVGQPGVVDVIDTRTMTLAEEVPTEAGAGTTAFDAQRQRLYVFLPPTCRVAVYDEV